LTEPSSNGAPTKYRELFDEQAYKLCLLGAVDSELADFFGVAESTINNWKHDYPSFLESIKKGKDIANANVAESMYKKAIGYSHPEDKIFNHNGEAMVVPTTKHYPPDTQAGSLFLRNRTSVEGSIGLNWRDKTEQEISGNIGLTDMSEDQLDDKINQLKSELEQSSKN